METWSLPLASVLGPSRYLGWLVWGVLPGGMQGQRWSVPVPQLPAWEPVLLVWHPVPCRVHSPLGLIAPIITRHLSDLSN